MRVKVGEFILANQRDNCLWEIDGSLFVSNEQIPKYILERYVLNWYVDFLNSIIEIATENHE